MCIINYCLIFGLTITELWVFDLWFGWRKRELLCMSLVIVNLLDAFALYLTLMFSIKFNDGISTNSFGNCKKLH